MPRLEVRCSDDELAAWKAKAEDAGLTVSSMVRSALDNAQLPDQRAADAVADLTRQVARIGNNLNQIAAWANTHKMAAEAAQVIAQMVAIQREIERVYQVVSEG